MIVVAANYSFGQEPFSILSDRIKEIDNQDIVIEKAFHWIKDDPDLHLYSHDRQMGKLIAKGKFDYTNEVVLEEVFLTPRIGERTSGVVNYEVIVTVKDTGYSIEFTNFTHISNYKEKDYSFGIIPKYADNFFNQCSEDPEWCKLVWMDLTKTARVKTRMKRIKANW
jgi:hypothetical protein